MPSPILASYLDTRTRQAGADLSASVSIEPTLLTAIHSLATPWKD
jgi:hypothetical protein